MRTMEGGGSASGAPGMPVPGTAAPREGEPCRMAEAAGMPSTETFLATLGQRVRQRRALVRMTRRQLAGHSGVSERYLAQLESGQGNMSIVLLRKVAVALGLPVAQLVVEGEEPS